MTCKKTETTKNTESEKTCESFINITPAAVAFIKASVEREKCLGIRLSVKSGGCSGMSYEMDFVREDPNPADVFVEQDGVKVYIAPKSALFVANMTMDYVTTPMGGNIVFENPNAKAKCSCGKSFSVDGSASAGAGACNSSECCGGK